MTQHSNESERLAALRSTWIMDSGKDIKFDVVAQLAAEIYDMPMAAISLLDNTRQWFKASVGMDMLQTPREWAFCNHAIQTPDEVFVVEDAQQDDRFRANPLVTGDPEIRFYAGASIRSRDGHALGALCVIDKRPRTISSIGRRQLQRLAASVSALLDLHRVTIELSRAAYTDLVTGLPNRRMFDQTLDATISQTLEGRPCSLIVIDLDGFKSINDLYGSRLGDKFLCQAASRIQLAARSCDFVARLGGDEFAILMLDQIDAGAPEAVVEKLYEAFSTPCVVEDNSKMLSISAGVAHSPRDAHERGALLRAADLSLCEAKRSEAARARASTGARKSIGRSQGRALEEALRDALRNNEIRVRWQPYVDTISGKVRGFEALARWTRDGVEEIPASIFVPFAEACGMVRDLDGQVLAAACTEAAKWSRPLRISINMSAQWFTTPHLTDYIGGLLGRTGLRPERLCLEVTERTVIATREMAKQQMESLRAMGVSVALDDFGIGFSSLSYLCDLPFNKLKLDRSFVAALENNERSKHVARTIVELGHGLGMTVCGEGVETFEQLRLLREFGCDLVQGYLIGKPSHTPQFVTPPSAMRGPDKPVASAA